MIFWIVAACMIAAALAALLAPLLRPRGRVVDAADYDIEVYRDQIAELDRDAKRGLLSGEEAEAARVEIARRILAADARREKSAGKSRESGQTATIAAVAVIAALLPAGALAVYLLLGQPGAPSMPLAGRTDIPASTADDASQAQAITELLARAQANPSDARAWRNLAEAYKSSRQYQEAVEAYRRALSLEPATPALNGEYGEALAMAAEGTITPEARAAFEAVLVAEPGDVRARHYLAVADYQAGRTREALDRWAALVAEAPADAPWLDLVREHIARAAADLGLDAAAVTPEPLPPGEGPDSLTPERRAAVEAMAPEERQAMIRGMVDRLAARLEDNPEDLEGWERLIRARMVLEEPAEAQAALDYALDIFAQAPVPRQRLAALAGELGLEGGAAGGAPDVGAMVERLAARLEDEPGDLEGWLMLARSYTVLGRPGEARDALARAAALAPENTQVLTLQARAIRAANGQTQTPDSIAIVRRVLVLEPDNLEALWFVGLAEADAGNTGRARELLERAWSLIPEDSPDRATLRQRIDELTGG